MIYTNVVLGQILGNYKIIRLLGAGGMGEVFLAQHTRIARQAAIKLLLPQVSRDPETVERFFNEARATSLIQHEGIIEILDCGTLDSRAYIIMEYLQGESLGALLARERSLVGDLGKLSFIGASVARALGAAHARGIVHRDLKPDNVYLAASPTRGGQVRVKILDFGIAKLTGADKEVGTSHTRAGTLMGTPLYMAPEQCRGAAVDHRADIYALGCILFEMATGRPPFVADMAGDLLVAHVTAIPPRASELDPRVPPVLDELIAQLLAKDPAERPSSMEDVAASLEAALGNAQAIGAQGQTASQPVFRATGAVGSTAILEPTPPVPSAPIDGPKRKPTSPGQSHRETTQPTQPSSGGRRALLVASLALLVLGGGAAAYLLTRPAHLAAQHPDAQGTGGNPTGGAEGGDQVAQAPPGMLAIRGRTFTMGSSPSQVEAGVAFCKSSGSNCRRDVFEREQPPRSVSVETFFLDANEVSNADLGRWLDGSGVAAADGRNVRDAKGRLLVDLHPLHGGVELAAGKFRARAGRESLPAVQVTWWGALAYCQAQGKRLPSEAEWESAARSTSGDEPLLFPWGTSKPTCDGVAFGGGAKGSCPTLRGPRSVGTAAMDVTPDGIRDMGGNVGEWVQDGFVAPYPTCAEDPCRNPVAPPDASETRTIRGGDWAQPADACRSAGRSRRPPDKAEINVGFRCAK